jgi:hypothetical protein
MTLAYRVVLRTIGADLRTIFACAAYDFTVSHETNSLPRNKIHSPAEKAEHHYYLKIHRRGMWLLFFNQSLETF